LSASLLGNQLDARREQLRNTLPIRRVVGPADIAALAVHIMTNTALTGGSYDIDGGQQIVENEPCLRRRRIMSEIEHYEILVIGSGEAGKHLTWNLAQSGHRTAVVERKYIGGSCPNIACLPSKNVIWSAKANWFARHGAEYGVQTGPASTDMKGVFNRKRKMVESEVQFHLDRFKATGAELICGEAHFIAPKAVEVYLNDGGRRTVTGDRLFLDLGSHAMMPDIPGLADAKPMTHIEALDLQRLPAHVIVLGGGYVGLELAQALRRFGTRVTIIERGSQVATAEDPDVSQAIRENFTARGSKYCSRHK
jgi:pyruvate/2-oxoglutarate dehydrogenase complex dihydrolipoamide dehydrogenase (E3) component